jgi:hypothetical protein
MGYIVMYDWPSFNQDRQISPRGYRADSVVHALQFNRIRTQNFISTPTLVSQLLTTTWYTFHCSYHCTSP